MLKTQTFSARSALLWFFIAIATGVYIAGPLKDPDLWWHLTIGNWILANHTLPVSEHWNRFSLGDPFRAYSWSTEILFSGVDQLFGEVGLLVLKLVLSALIACSLFYFFGKLAEDWFFGGVLGMFATAALHSHFTLRPQSFVWIYFICLIFLAECLAREGMSKKRLVLLIVVMMLWANTHITTVFGIGTVFLWLIGRVELRTTLVATGCSFFGTLCTPYLGAEWLTFFSKTGHPFQHRMIAEFVSATILQFPTGFLVIAGAVFLLLLHQRPRVLWPGAIVLAAGFTFGAAAVVKFIPFAIIILCAFIALIWQKEGDSLSKEPGIAQGFSRLQAQFERIPKEGLAFVFLCVAVINIQPAWMLPVDQIITPVSALDMFQEKKLPLPLMNGFGKGGYVMYRLSNPDGSIEHPVSIDGRTNMIPHNVWIAYDAALRGKENWKDYFDLVKPQTVLWRVDSPLPAIMKATGEWCVVHRSGTKAVGYLLFVRREWLREQRQNGAELPSENC